MHKLILATLICLSGICTQQELKAAQRAPISNDTLIAAGISAAGAGLLYLAYKLNYKNTLAQAHTAVTDCQNQLLEISRHGNNYFQVEQPLFWPTDINRAYSLAAEIKNDIAQLQNMRITIERHQSEWKGYKDFNHAEAEMFIFDAKIMEKNLQQTLTMLQQTIIDPLEAQIKAENARLEALRKAEQNRQNLIHYTQKQTESFSLLFQYLSAHDVKNLKEQIFYEWRNSQYPLVGAVLYTDRVLDELIRFSSAVPREEPIQLESDLLKNNLKFLLKWVLNTPEYSTQKEQKRISDLAEEEVAEKKRQARAQIEAQQRIAQAAEQQAQAERDRARAEQQRANAEHIRAQAEAEKARVERERWNQEWWNDVLGVKKEKPEVNVTIHNN